MDFFEVIVNDWKPYDEIYIMNFSPSERYFFFLKMGEKIIVVILTL